MKIFKFLKESAKNFSETQNGNFLRIMRLKIYYLILVKKVCTLQRTKSGIQQRGKERYRQAERRTQRPPSPIHRHSHQKTENHKHTETEAHTTRATQILFYDQISNGLLIGKRATSLSYSICLEG